MRQLAAPLLLVALSSTFLLVFGVAALIAGSFVVASACLLSLPVTAALATFRWAVTPLEVALSLSLPLTLLAIFFAVNTPTIATGLTCAAFLSLAFGVALLSGYFGSYRKRKLGADSADA
jgi:hypothetical protein